MEFRDTPEEAAFRTQVRTFINAKFPSVLKGVSAFEQPDDPDIAAAMKEWRTAVGKQGWTAPHWPKEYGGAGMSVVEQFVYSEEMAMARAPQTGGSGVQMLGPVLIRYGSEEQQKEHLPRITSGEVQWCQGYS
ncbi:MAG TPA: acyl-CoA dehydrogenase family protein, partial [Tepidiformaceae bacterium]|nr:acyl-CoA dehydrogenase family protein [Tepidiformaceae bacterium]